MEIRKLGAHPDAMLQIRQSILRDRSSWPVLRGGVGELGRSSGAKRGVTGSGETGSGETSGARRVQARQAGGRAEQDGLGRDGRGRNGGHAARSGFGGGTNQAPSLAGPGARHGIERPAQGRARAKCGRGMRRGQAPYATHAGPGARGGGARDQAPDPGPVEVRTRGDSGPCAQRGTRRRVKCAARDQAPDQARGAAGCGIRRRTKCGVRCAARDQAPGQARGVAGREPRRRARAGRCGRRVRPGHAPDVG